MITKEEITEYLKEINALKDGISSYAYEEEHNLKNGDTVKWVIFAVNDYDFYMNDKSFRKLMNEAVIKHTDTIFSVYRPLTDKIKKELKDKIIIP